MATSSDRNDYFRKHLFRTGLECPTRLFYKANRYPENEKALPFIEHHRFNKQQLRNLLRSSYPKGVRVDALSTLAAYERTRELASKTRSTIFNATFVHDRCKARVPILDKKGSKVQVFNIQTRAFNAGKHDVSNSQGEIYSKWRDYLIDFAYQVHIITLCFPEWEITPLLVLPSKYAEAESDALLQQVKQVEESEVTARKVKADRENLLVKLDVTDEITRIRGGEYLGNPDFKGKSFDEVLQELADLYFNKRKYPVTIGTKCRYCEFKIEQERYLNGEKSGFRECWSEAITDRDLKPTDESVFDLIGPGRNRWAERGVFLQQQIPEGEFYDLDTIDKTEGRITEKQRQSLQIRQSRGLEVPPEIIKPRLFTELKRWEYPIHFVDFEAGNYVMPIRKGRSPYHLVVFQYSCHTLYEDGSWEHHEWIDSNDNGYSNYELIRRLKEIPNILKGTLVQYSDFERNTIKTIRKELKEEWERVPDAGELYDWMTDIIRRKDSTHRTSPFLADLSRMVKHYYYNHRMQDSLSIKDVLQSVLTVSPHLKEIYSKPYSSSNFNAITWWQEREDQQAASPYQLMVEEQTEHAGVRRGTEAMVVYARLLTEELTQEERETHRRALLRYCEVDTLAMLMIYQHWAHLMQEERN